MNMLEQTYTLYNGVELPKIGFGTWQIEPGDETYRAVSKALRNGYRHIDTAQAYRNEASVGEAVRNSGIPREDIFITTKLESHIKTYDEALAAFEKSLDALKTDYVDLFLIHAPWPWNEVGKDCRTGNREAWKALEKIYEEGRARAIGVSNFKPNDLEDLIGHCSVVPHVNQIAYFIGLDQKETVDYCRAKNIFIEAYSPLGIGYLLSNETIGAMAKRYGVTPAQICIRYDLQKGTAPLPKSVHEDRMIENAQVDFRIKDEDMAILDAIEDDPRKRG
ncbi:MAG: aldo/keto reductase [Acholeplasmataceae bacterium]